MTLTSPEKLHEKLTNTELSIKRIRKIKFARQGSLISLYGSHEIESSLSNRSPGRDSQLSSISYQIVRTMQRKNPVKLSSYDNTSNKSRKYKTINQYRVVQDLGCGASSRVVLAKDANGI